MYTPDDSVVLGGNFLHGLDIPLQLEADAIESRRKVPDKFRFPFFRELHLYAAGNYLAKLRNGDRLSARELDNLSTLINALEMWIEETSQASPSNPANKRLSIDDASHYVTQSNGCLSVYDFLQKLRLEHQKVVHKITVNVPTTTGADNVSLANPFGRQGLNIIPPEVSASTTRVSLGSPKSPKIRLKLKISGGGNKSKHAAAATSSEINTISSSAALGMTTKPETNAIADGGFRISISSAAKVVHNPKGPKKEDTCFVDNNDDDDDWVPSFEPANPVDDFKIDCKSGRPTKGSKKAVSTTNNKKRHSALGESVQMKSTKKTKSTARQRLLKKFR